MKISGGHGNSLQYSCLGHPIDRGIWWAIVHRVAKSWTWLNTHTHKWNWLVFLIWVLFAAAAAKLLQLCPTLCDPVDGSPTGSTIPRILKVRTLEWVAISFSNAWKSKVKVKLLSRVWLFATPWTAAHQAPPSMGFSRQDYCSGVPSPSPENKTLGIS